MKKLLKKKWFIPVVIGAVSLIAAIIIIIVVNSNKSYRVIKLEDYEGDVVVNRGSQLLELFSGLQLSSGDSSATGEESLMHLLVDSDKHMLVTPNTEFKIKASGTEEKGKVKIVLDKGKAYFEVDNKLNENSSFDVVTPNATTSIRGTRFLTLYEPEQNTTHVYCSNGKVEVSYGKNQVIDVNPGEAVSIVDDTAVKELSVSLRIGYTYDVTSDDIRNRITYRPVYSDSNNNFSIEILSPPVEIQSAFDKHSDDIWDFFSKNHEALEERIKNGDFVNSATENVSVWFPDECTFDFGKGNQSFQIEECNIDLSYYNKITGFPEGAEPQEIYHGRLVEYEGNYYCVAGVYFTFTITPKENIPN